MKMRTPWWQGQDRGTHGSAPELLSVRAEEDAHDAAEEGERQQGVAHHDDADVDAEKGTVEHGHHLSYGRVHLVDVAYQEEEA